MRGLFCSLPMDLLINIVPFKPAVVNTRLEVLQVFTSSSIYSACINGFSPLDPTSTLTTIYTNSFEL